MFASVILDRCSASMLVCRSTAVAARDHCNEQRELGSNQDRNQSGGSMDDLAKRDYLRQRIEPKPGDRYYPRLYRLGVSARSTACYSEAAHITRRA
jgi:hypothetical protein